MGVGAGVSLNGVVDVAAADAAVVGYEHVRAAGGDIDETEEELGFLVDTVNAKTVDFLECDVCVLITNG